MKPERLSFFSDGVFAVLITVLVLELHPPEHPTIAALLEHWPSWLSYAVSYLFIAIVWANHHYLLHHAIEATPRLMWFNFAHLFSVSLLPLSTAWMAVSRLSPQPVAFYAAVFFFVNVTYILLIGTDQGTGQEHAHPLLCNACSVRNRIGRRVEISLCGPWNLLLLPDRLSQAGRAALARVNVARRGIMAQALQSLTFFSRSGKPSLAVR